VDGSTIQSISDPAPWPTPAPVDPSGRSQRAAFGQAAPASTTVSWPGTHAPPVGVPPHEVGAAGTTSGIAVCGAVLLDAVASPALVAMMSKTADTATMSRRPGFWR
jgi:hypothetical protein